MRKLADLDRRRAGALRLRLAPRRGRWRNPLDFVKELHAFSDDEVRLVMRDNCLEPAAAAERPRDRRPSRRRPTTTPARSPTCRRWLDEHWDPDLTVARVVGARRRRGMDGAALPARVGRPRLLRAARSSRCAPRSSVTARCCRRAASVCSWPRPRSSATAPRSRSSRYVPPIYNGSVGVVPAVQRTGLGLRPRRPLHPRDARRRPLGDLGPEGVELDGAWTPTTACSSPAPTSTSRSTRASRGSRSRSTSRA